MPMPRNASIAATRWSARAAAEGAWLADLLRRRGRFTSRSGPCKAVAALAIGRADQRQRRGNGFRPIAIETRPGTNGRIDPWREGRVHGDAACNVNVSAAIRQRSGGLRPAASKVGLNVAQGNAEPRLQGRKARIAPLQ